MTEDSAAVQFDDAPPSEPGPAVDYSPTWEKDDSWVLAIGRDAPTPEEARAQVQATWGDFRRRLLASDLNEDLLMEGVEKAFSTSQAAEFFGRSTQWVYWGLRKDARTGEQVFVYRDGTPIQPERVGKMGKRRFTLPIIREIALCCFRRGNLTEDELEAVMARILLAEFGKKAFALD